MSDCFYHGWRHAQYPCPNCCRHGIADAKNECMICFPYGPASYLKNPYVEKTEASRILELENALRNLREALSTTPTLLMPGDENLTALDYIDVTLNQGIDIEGLESRT